VLFNAFHLILAKLCNYAYYNLIQDSSHNVFAFDFTHFFECVLYVDALLAFK
jgi:hypothetical protein